MADIPRDKQCDYFDLLADCLKPIRDDFEISLIDFRGSQARTLPKIGLRAAGWWLLPNKPDWVSAGAASLGPTRELFGSFRREVQALDPWVIEQFYKHYIV